MPRVGFAIWRSDEEDDQVISGPSGIADTFFRGIAYALYLAGSALLVVFLFWAYRMVAVGGSVSSAWQMAISRGWDTVAFVGITVFGGALCLFAATSLLNAGRRKD
jgi:hypothetical protein